MRPKAEVDQPKHYMKAQSEVFDRLPGLFTSTTFSCKSLQVNFRPKPRKFRRHFKGVFRNSNMEVRILPGSALGRKRHETDNDVSPRHQAQHVPEQNPMSERRP